MPKRVCVACAGDTARTLPDDGRPKTNSTATAANPNVARASGGDQLLIAKPNNGLVGEPRPGRSFLDAKNAIAGGAADQQSREDDTFDRTYEIARRDPTLGIVFSFVGNKGQPLIDPFPRGDDAP